MHVVSSILSILRNSLCVQATDNIVGETCRILGCDRATIFTLDAVAKELVLSVAEGAKNIRVPVGQVLALHSLHYVSFHFN